MSSPSWSPSFRLRVLLWWTCVTFLTGWLPAIRGALDGSTYRWSTSYFGYTVSGAGIGGDYWFALLKVVLGITILALGWRGARAPFGYLLVGWQLFGFADSLHAAVTHPEDFRFRGDTLGVNISLAWLAPTFYGGALTLALSWFVSQRSNRLLRDPGWARRNTWWFVILAAPLPVQAFLLRSGIPHGTTDQFGVLLTIFQWLLIPFALRPSISRLQIR